MSNQDRFSRSFEMMAATSHDDLFEIEGRAIHYNTPTLIRGSDSRGKPVEWFEIIDKNALSNCDTGDVPMLLEHNRKEVIARSRGGSLQFDNRPDGLYIRAKMLTTKGREVWESVKAGLLTGFSFAFPVDSGMRKEGTHQSKPLVRVTEIKRLLDVSVVFSPAYSGTFANARSADMVVGILHEEQKQLEETMLSFLKEFGGKYRV